MKGDNNTYIPSAGDTCLISGPNCDDRKGYVYSKMEVLWIDDTFILYRSPGCWPVLEKIKHVAIKPCKAVQTPSEINYKQFYKDIECHIDMMVSPEMRMHACADPVQHDLAFQVFRLLSGYGEALEELNK